MAYGTVYPSTGSLLCASSCTARSAAVTVPAPAHAPSRMTGFMLST